MTGDLWEFVAESNRIEGIRRPPTLTVGDLGDFVAVVAGAKLRDSVGMNVRVGNHYPPSGGPAVCESLLNLVHRVNAGNISAWEAHIEYETLHPFMDGNGRSGRALWLWMMRGNAPLGFLHKFYYQTLDASGGRS